MSSRARQKKKSNQKAKPMKSRQNRTSIASSSKKIRYAVVGLGHIAQVAVLPAFKNAKNSKLTALISGDPEKLKKIGRKYKIENLFSYDDFDQALESKTFDAIYIALPNDMHPHYAIRALKAGIHVLCEKPLAASSEQCKEVVEWAEESGLCFMTAYRLHFNPANLKAVELAQNGKLGDLRYFSSTFSFQITDLDNIRLQARRGGGPLRDIGIYCINAARYLFRNEPTKVNAMAVTPPDDERFTEVPEAMSVSMMFPKNRLATFTISFGASKSSAYDLVGTKARLRLENAYEYTQPMTLIFESDKSNKKFSFRKMDQFGPEIEYFSTCIQQGKTPEASAREGLKDMMIIEAIEASIESGTSVDLNLDSSAEEWPGPDQAISKPSFSKPREVKVNSPHS